MSAHSNTPRTLVFDHVNGLVRWLTSDELHFAPVAPVEPPGPLNRAQHWLWRRPRGRALGNCISDLRYWLWRLSR